MWDFSTKVASSSSLNKWLTSSLSPFLGATGWKKSFFNFWNVLICKCKRKDLTWHVFSRGAWYLRHNLAHLIAYHFRKLVSFNYGRNPSKTYGFFGPRVNRFCFSGFLTTLLLANSSETMKWNLSSFIKDIINDHFFLWATKWKTIARASENVANITNVAKK